jgi:membrane protein YqaA with SNARE-associated domain
MTDTKQFDWHLWQRMYDRVLEWAAHKRAPAILSVLSFSESSFFPIPPDVMLAPMCLAQPRKSWRFAALCTLSSVLGGFLGYLIGRWAFSAIEPWLMTSSYAGVFQVAVEAFQTWGVMYILLAGFTPIPYKIFTISAGVVGMPFLPFVLGSIVGRGGRFFLVAGIIRVMGDRAAEQIRAWVDWAGWIVILLVTIGIIVWWMTGGFA